MSNCLNNDFAVVLGVIMKMELFTLGSNVSRKIMLARVQPWPMCTKPMLVYFDLWFIRYALLSATSLNSFTMGCHPLGFREFALLVTNKVKPLNTVSKK